MDGRWWRLAAILVVGRALDLISTYVATPDLSKELNPVVVTTGTGWIAVFAVTLPFIALCLWAYAYYLRHPGPAPPAGTTAWGALAFVQFGPGVPTWHLLWRFPTRGRWLSSLGDWWVPAMAVGTFPVFLFNFLMMSSRDYRSFVAAVSGHSAAVYLLELVMLLTMVGLTCVVLWRSRPARSAANSTPA